MRAVAYILICVGISLSSAAWAAETALIVIDMQAHYAERSGYHTKPSNASKLQLVLQKQVELIQLARAHDYPVVFLEFAGHEPTNSLLTEAVSGYRRTTVIVKARNGVFDDAIAARKLREYLELNDVSRLIVSGANGGFCVQCSIEGALQNRFQVVAEADAIIEFNEPEFVYPYSYADGQLYTEPRALLGGFTQIQNIQELMTHLRLGEADRCAAASSGARD